MAQNRHLVALPFLNQKSLRHCVNAKGKFKHLLINCVNDAESDCALVLISQQLEIHEDFFAVD
jgi:hypothetical protein